MSIFRFIIFLLVLFFAHLLFYQYLSVGEVYPDLFLVLVVYSALRWGSVGGSVSGFICGMVQDSFSFTYFGLHVLTKTFIGFTIGKMRHSFFSNLYIVQAALIFSAKILHDAIFYGVYLFNSPGGFWHQIVFHTIPASLYTCSLGVLLYIPFNLKTRTKRW
ncbi:MAG TPA: rod shape-determining protein MreD [archaeon]|nr:rod shape-determining protein MreD [archaeon]